MEIIEAGIKELKYVAPLFDAYRQFYDKPSDVVAAAHFIQARMEKKESVIFLAYNTQTQTDLGNAIEPLGFAQLYPSFSSVRMCPIWILNDLFVLPQYRSQGVGFGLIEKAKQLVHTTGANGLMLETGVTNKNAQDFYIRQGFTQNVETLIYFIVS